MSRDAYRSKTYEAEDELRFIANNGVTEIDFYGSTLELPEPRRFGDLAGVKRFVDAVCALPVVHDKYPTRKPAPNVVPYGGTRFAKYNHHNNVIRVPDHQGSKSSWAMNELIILHELAHYFISDTEKETGIHGTEFCVCFMFLLEHVLGGGWHLLLMRGLDQRGVPLHVNCSA